MRRNRPVHWESLLLVLLIGSAAGPLSAEPLCQDAAAVPDLECRYLLLPGATAGITEEPDPITLGGEGQGASSPSGVIPHAAPAEGSAQVVSANGITVATWVAITAGNRDIVFSQWHPDGWHQEFLTLGGSNEVGPRIAIGSDGAVYVAWWETDEPRRVRMARRDPATGVWGQPAAFAGMYGGRPSVLALPGGGVLVAFERRGWSGGQDVVIRRAGISGGPIEEVLAHSFRLGPLAIELHLHGGSRPFIDWVHASGYFGYSELVNGRWGASLDSRPLTQRAGNPRPLVEIQPAPR